jgi:tetratricopeptide (TPR) repeat protein
LHCGSCKGKLSVVPREGLFRQQYLINRLVNEDSASSSFLVRDIKTGQDCRLREFIPPNNDSVLKKIITKRFAEEARLLTAAEHVPDGARLLGFFTYEQRYYCAEEWIEGVSLEDQRRAEGRVEEAALRQLLEELLSLTTAFARHDPPLVHGEIRAANLIRRHDNGGLALIEWARLKDITQIAYVYDETITIAAEHIPGWLPPERRNFQLTPTVDLYGTAAACLEFWTASPCEKLYDRIQHRWLWKEIGLPEPLGMMLRWMLESQPQRRPQSAEEVSQTLKVVDAAEAQRAAGRPGAAVQEYRLAAGRLKTEWLEARIAEMQHLLQQKKEARAAQTAAATAPIAASRPVATPPPPPVAPPPAPASRPNVPPPQPTAYRPPLQAPAAATPISIAPSPRTVAPAASQPAAQAPTQSVPAGGAAKRLPAILAVAGALLLVLTLVIVLMDSTEQNIINAIGRGQLVAPVGASAYDLFRQARQKNSLSAEALNHIADKALPPIESTGDAILRKFHDTSKVNEEEWATLEKMCGWAAELRPGNNRYRARLAYCRGQLAMLRNHFGDAASLFREASDNESCWAMAFNGMGRAAFRQQNFAQAENLYRRATACEPNWVFPHQNLCGLYYRDKQYAMAESECQTTVRLDERRAGAHYFLGLIYEQQKRYCDAARSYQKALRFADPNDAGFNTKAIEKKAAFLASKHKCG